MKNTWQFSDNLRKTDKQLLLQKYYRNRTKLFNTKNSTEIKTYRYRYSRV